MLAQEIERLSVQHKRDDNSGYTTLSLKDARILAEKHNATLKEIEETALRSNIIPARYTRNAKTITAGEQLQLSTSHVAVIGLGGLGGAVVDILARTGVGELTLIDGDVFDETNLNRQLLSSVSAVGRPKAEVAAQHVTDVNPAAIVHEAGCFFTDENGGKLLKNSRLAVDCLDTISARFSLERCCSDLQIPLVSAAVAGTSGQATTILPGDTGYSRIYGTARNSSARGIESILGTLCYAAYHMATVQCVEAITLLLGREPELRNRLYLAEIADHTGDIMEF